MTISTPPAKALDQLPHSYGRFERVSRLLDREFKIPGLSVRFVLDGLIGFIPVAGDVLTGIMGLYALKVAADYGVPWTARIRIIFNVLVDFVIGTIPVIGDLFDFFFHAHYRNFQIIQKHVGSSVSEE